MKPRVASEYTAPRRAPLRVEESVGEPAAISCLARMLLKLHARPGLQLVHDADADGAVTAPPTETRQEDLAC